MKIINLVKEEAKMPKECKRYFKENYIHTEKVINLLDSLILEIRDIKGKDAYIFISLMHRHLILALLSTTRLHRAEFAWNMRQAIEAGAQATYCIANRIDNPEQFITPNFENANKQFIKKCYRWLETNHSEENNVIKLYKETINRMGTHLGFTEAQTNSQIVSDSNNIGVEISYFDNARDEKIKTDLWIIANTGCGFIKFFLKLNSLHNVFQTSNNSEKKLIKLGHENNEIRIRLMTTPYYTNLLAELSN
jgi:hypothetical protein